MLQVCENVILGIGKDTVINRALSKNLYCWKKEIANVLMCIWEQKFDNRDFAIISGQKFLLNCKKDQKYCSKSHGLENLQVNEDSIFSRARYNLYSRR